MEFLRQHIQEDCKCLIDLGKLYLREHIRKKPSMDQIVHWVLLIGEPYGFKWLLSYQKPGDKLHALD